MRSSPVGLHMLPLSPMNVAAKVAGYSASQEDQQMVPSTSKDLRKQYLLQHRMQGIAHKDRDSQKRRK